MTLVVMLEGHVLRALLTPEIKTASWFLTHEAIHHITAPAFLLASGFSFAIPTRRHIEENISCSPRLLRRVRRMIWIVALGYALNLPFLSLSKTLSDTTAAGWARLASFDVLQGLGVTLLLLQAMFFHTKTPRRFLIVGALLGAIIVIATPLLWAMKPGNSLPMILASALTIEYGSAFPLFPYSAYLIAGAIISFIFLYYARKEQEGKIMFWLLPGGVSLVAASLFFDSLPVTYYEPYNYWLTSPNFFLLTLGFLMSLLSGCWFLEKKVIGRLELEETKLHWVAIFGRESLFVYVVHLVVLFGWLTNPKMNLVSLWSERLTTIEASIVFILLTGTMFVLSLSWNYLKRHHPVLIRGLLMCLTITFFYHFLLNPY